MVQLNSLKPLLESIENPVLGLDAYGVIYNDKGFFDTLPQVFDYCKQHAIPIMMLTNNATQSVDIIFNKMKQFKLDLPKKNIVSSGCGLYDLVHLKSIVKNKNIYVYGYDSSKQYVIDAGGFCVDYPNKADVIVMAASVGSKNHITYRQVFLTLKNKPHLPVICVNPDFYVYNSNGFLPVMGFYAHQMANQLDRDDFIWMGKPFKSFSELVKTRLKQLNYTSSKLVFCDDNPLNVRQLTKDIGCKGVVITQTGIFNKVSVDHDSLSDLYKLLKCKI